MCEVSGMCIPICNVKRYCYLQFCHIGNKSHTYCINGLWYKMQLHLGYKSYINLTTYPLQIKPHIQSREFLSRPTNFGGQFNFFTKLLYQVPNNTKKKSTAQLGRGTPHFGPRPFFVMLKSSKNSISASECRSVGISLKILFRPRGTTFSLTTKRLDIILNHFLKIFRKKKFWKKIFFANMFKIA